MRIFLTVVKIVVSALIIITLLFTVSLLTRTLLKDKFAKTTVEEGKYILNRLAEDYEELLRLKREELVKERERLLSEQGIAATLNEKRSIESKLRELEGRSKDVNKEYEKMVVEKKELEKSLQARIDVSGKEISQLNEQYLSLNEKYLDLSVKKESDDKYWEQYINDLREYFLDHFKDSPQKISEIETSFNKITKGKEYIKNEFTTVYFTIRSQENNIKSLQQNDTSKKSEINDLKYQIEQNKDIIAYYEQYKDIIDKFSNIRESFNNAKALFRNKKYILSAAEYRKVLDELDEVRESYRTLAKLDLDNDNAQAKDLYDKAQKNIDNQRYEIALNQLSTIIRDLPKSDYVRSSLQSILRITNHLANSQLITKDNIGAQQLVKEAEKQEKKNELADAVATYNQIIREYPYSDYTNAALDKSIALNNKIVSNRFQDYDKEIKEYFSINYKIYEEYYQKGDLEKARNYYFGTLDTVLGNYANNTIVGFKQFEDRYIELLIKNYEKEWIRRMSLTSSN